MLLCLLPQRGCGVRAWGPGNRGAGKGREGAEGVDVDYAPNVRAKSKSPSWLGASAVGGAPTLNDMLGCADAGAGGRAPGTEAAMLARLVIGVVVVALLPAAANAQEIKVTLLGTGTPVPAMNRFGPSILVEAGGQKLLFDAGRGRCSA